MYDSHITFTHHIKCIYTLLHGGCVYTLYLYLSKCEPSRAKLSLWFVRYLSFIIIIVMYHSGAGISNCVYAPNVHGHGHAYYYNKLVVYVRFHFIIVVVTVIDFLWIEIGLENCDNKTLHFSIINCLCMHV